LSDQINNLKPLTFSLDKLSEFIETLKDNAISVLISDYYGNIVYVNKVFEDRTGYTLSEVKGKNPRFLKSDETNSEKHKILWKTITEGNEWRGEFKNKRKNGELFWEYSTIYPMIGNDNKITHFLSLKEDISQIKLLETSLAETSNKKKKSSELKFEFLKQISLEIRNPLYSIVDFVQLLMERLESKDYTISSTYLDILNQQCIRVLNSTKMLIDISEIKNKVSEVKLDFLDKNFMNNLIDEIKVPVSTIMGILFLLKEEYNKRFEEEIVTGFNVIHSDSKRILSILDIIHECSLNENNEIKFYKNVLTGIYEEKEKLKIYSNESTAIEPAIKQVIQNNLISGNVEEITRENQDVISLPDIEINIESSSLSFNRDANLLFEEKNYNNLIVVFINTNRATLKNATDFKKFITGTLKSSSRNYVIDLSACDYIDSTFVGVLVFFKKEMDKNNGNIVLVLNRNNFVLESFALLNLELLFKLYSDLKSALIDRK